MHAEGVQRGGSFQWMHFFDPAPELLARFEDHTTHHEPDWHLLEPEFSSP